MAHARTRIAELAAALGEASGAVAKAAGDVVLLAQTEVGEVARAARTAAAPRPCRTSTTRWRRSRRSPARARRPAWWPISWARWSTSTSAPPARGTPSGLPLRELLRSTGSAAAWLRECLEQLEVDPERMRANLDDALLAERVAGAIGGSEASALVREALGAGQPLAEVARAHLSEDEAARVLDPATYLGATDQLIDRALSAHAHRS